MSSQKFVLCLLISSLWLFIQVSTQETPQFPRSLIAEMANRETRFHYHLWHNIRDKWLQLDESTQAKIKELNWDPPRPAKKLDANGKLVAIPDNDSGEDFLYMNKYMISRANKILSENNEPYGRITGWKTIPAPGDPDWPVSGDYLIPNEETSTDSTRVKKSDDFYDQNIKPMEDLFKDPEQLRSMTLGQLGSRLEMTMYSWLQARFSSDCPYGFRPSTNKTPLEMDKHWDDPLYDWLGDSYAAQVNPIFWKIIGWIDNIVENWKDANNLAEITWKGTWIGGPLSSMPKFMMKAKQNAVDPVKSAPKNLRTNNKEEKSGGCTGQNKDDSTETESYLEEVARAFAMSGSPESSFADEVIIEGFWPPPEPMIESSFADEVYVEGWSIPDADSEGSGEN